LSETLNEVAGTSEHRGETSAQTRQKVREIPHLRVREKLGLLLSERSFHECILFLMDGLASHLSKIGCVPGIASRLSAGSQSHPKF